MNTEASTFFDPQTFLDGLTEDVRDGMLLAARGEMARRWKNPEGFGHFFWCIFGLELPAHALRWVQEIFAAHEEETGVLLEAFRGSTKSTVLGAFAAFIQGHRPWGSTIILQANDSAANLSSGLIASVIEHSRGWKACFPAVVPDKERGWGAEGYFVRDLRYPKAGETCEWDTLGDYGDWLQKCESDHQRDPSFVAMGVTSGSVVGKHPSNCLLLDDILDENNTSSERERVRVKRVLTGNVYPIMSRPENKPFIGVAFTSWDLDDAYQDMKGWGILRYVVTPVYTVDPDSEDTYRGQHVTYAWPGVYDEKKIMEQETMTGERDFARMFLCDMARMAGINLRLEWLHPFPYESIQPSWPVYMGVDFASSADRNIKRDYFSMALGRTIPNGGVVVVDGINERLSTGEAIERLQSWASRYATLRVIGVEKWGKGEEFFNLLINSTSLPVIALPIKGTKGMPKGIRFEREMAPMFEYSRAWVSSVQTAYLRTFRDQWASWPTGSFDDTLDAVYWLLVAAASHLMVAAPTDSLMLDPNKRPKNPYSAFARTSGRPR